MLLLPLLNVILVVSEKGTAIKARQFGPEGKRMKSALLNPVLFGTKRFMLEERESAHMDLKLIRPYPHLVMSWGSKIYNVQVA